MTGRAEVLPLRWGDSVAHLSPPFDLVLASDVAYDAACVPALISTFAALCGPATRGGLLAFESRPPVTDMAVALLPEHGLVGLPVRSTNAPQHASSVPGTLLVDSSSQAASVAVTHTPL